MASKLCSSNIVPIVLRVKRKRTDEPADTLVVANKLRKLNSTERENVGGDGGGGGESVFCFAGTVQTQEESPKDLMTHVSYYSDHSSLVKLSPFSKLCISDQKRDQREEKNALISQRRFKLVSRYRSLEKKLDRPPDAQATGQREKDDQVRKRLHDELVHVYDLEEEGGEESGMSGVSNATKPFSSDENFISDAGAMSSITCNSSPMLRENTLGSSKFVYDLYYAHSNTPDMLLSEWPLVSARLYNHEFVDDVVELEEEMCYDDDEDSNDEGHWRNEYPDEVGSDEDESLNENYRGKASYLGGNGEENSYLDGSYWDEQH